uniref:Uncharacterized protein n=1 Tax=Paracidobacterium acidisoli TaxID=2303751 RepID=A0A372IJE0_9BACT
MQGIDLDQEHVWVTSVDSQNKRAYLHQFNRTTAKLERTVDLTDGRRYHPGGFSIYKDSIWVPVAEYKPHSSAVLVELDKNTLRVKRRIVVPDHIGCLAVTDDSLVGGNWDSAQLYVWNVEGKRVRVIDNRSGHGYQDIKFAADGDLVGSGGGAVDWYSWPSMKPVRSLHSGSTDRGKPYTSEGMAIKGNDLYFLPEDGPAARLFHFSLAEPGISPLFHR